MAAWILSPRAGRRIRPCISPRPPEVKRRPVRGLFSPAAAPVSNRQKRIDGAVTATGLMRPTLGLTRAASGKRGPARWASTWPSLQRLAPARTMRRAARCNSILGRRAVAGLTGATKGKRPAAGPAFGRSPARGCPSRARRPPGPAALARSGSPQWASMCLRTPLRSASTPCQWAPSEATGGQIVTLSGPGRGRHESAGRIPRVPVIAIGTTGRWFSAATWKAPRRNGRRPGRAVNVPSAKKKSGGSARAAVASACASATPRRESKRSTKCAPCARTADASAGCS